MIKDFHYAELFEIYKGLLTKKQREMFSSFFLFDLSLAEIAEPEGRSRQSVYSALKQVKAKLEEYESVLGLLSKNKSVYGVAEQLKKEGNPLGDKLTEILEK